jgi:hypothetical protein
MMIKLFCHSSKTGIGSTFWQYINSFVIGLRDRMNFYGVKRKTLPLDSKFIVRL